MQAAIEPLGAVADNVTCVVAPREFGRVGFWYDNYDEVTDADALAALHGHDVLPGLDPGEGHLPLIQEVSIAIPGARLAADLVLPSTATSAVLFAHGSGSNRHSPRNWQVARALLDAGFGVALLDLLTLNEQLEDRKTAEHRFNIPLLTARVTAALDWLDGEPRTHGMALGGYGASTGAAATLRAAAADGCQLQAVVSRGGRVDLAEDALTGVRAPVLMVAGSADPETLAMNQRLLPAFGGPASVQVVDGADHLFDDPDHLDSLAGAAVAWFRRYL
jgi:putative phosphoribosyl transferase